jgi:hypothetical protein
VTGEEDRIENLNKKGFRLPWKFFKAMFRILFGPGTLLILRSSWLVNFRSLVGVMK